MIKSLNCDRCGDCCKHLTITLSEEDLSSWKKLGRWDIFKHVKLRIRDQQDGIDWIISRPSRKELKMIEKYQILEVYLIPLENGYDYSPCPFLERKNGIFSCLIQDIKPESCHDFLCKKYGN